MAVTIAEGRAYYLIVNGNIRDAVGAAQGDTVQVVLEPDTEARTVEVPQDFRQALESTPEAGTAFEALSFSHQKEYVDWIIEAKKVATRQGRIEKALLILIEGRKLK